MRHYERKGVIQKPPRQANGYRAYPPETLARVQLVRRALAIGFTLDELTEILRVRDAGGAPCRRVRDLAASKLETVEKRLQETLTLRDELRAALKDWGARLAQTPKNKRSGLLETLDLPKTLQPKHGTHFTTTLKNNPGKKRNMKLLATIALATLGASSLLGHDDKDSSMAGCPAMQGDSGMNERGNQGMGFSQAKTTHHFRLAPDGGAIEVSSNNVRDNVSRNQIRMHLGHIAKMFQQGNFEIPMFVHAKLPDAAATMQKEKGNIRYIYEETEGGGRVRIRTNNPTALKAVHEFLRFQITEHRTGDPVEVGGTF